MFSSIHLAKIEYGVFACARNLGLYSALMSVSLRANVGLWPYWLWIGQLQVGS